jgi:hypothetical protein
MGFVNRWRTSSSLRMARGTRLIVVAFVVLGLAAPALPQEATSKSGRVARLNAAFLRHVRDLEREQAIAATTILEGWESTYRDELPGSFVPDALAVLYPAYRQALEAFDEQRPADVVRALEPLRGHDDPFLAANAEYFYVRALVELGQYEPVETALASVDQRTDYYGAHTPYAPHLLFIRGFCEARNLRFEQATRSLQAVAQEFGDDVPEAVRVGVQQLLLEIERRALGTLAEVATVMDYVADRLKVADATDRVRERQHRIVAMLDRLIQEQEAKEQQAGGVCQSGGDGGSRAQTPRTPRERSEAPGGEGRFGDLHEAPSADPGQMWGKLPPAERERILQSIRERFPSRYRQLVEQYYRALAEEK